MRGMVAVAWPCLLSLGLGTGRHVSRLALLLLLLPAIGAACRDGGPSADAAPVTTDAARGWRRGVPLPEPLANNAVALLESEGGCMIYSALGLDASLDGAGATRRAYRWREGDASWSELPEVPGSGRLAASAVGLRGDLYLLGGYSVGDSGAETSHDSLQVFNLRTGQWADRAPLPVPIDDAVAVAWRDRWIVVVSGWSNTRNRDAVQIYDVETDRWELATPFPGTPVFGHAGALSGDDLLIVDGVASSLGFPIVSQAWRARLDPDDPTRIAWTEIDPAPGPPRYRAAAGTAPDGRIFVNGGTDVPYNFDGLSYASGEPAPPLATTVVFDPARERFSELGRAKPVATMDHRGLLPCGDRLFTVGGLVAGPAATGEVWSLAP